MPKPKPEKPYVPYLPDSRNIQAQKASDIRFHRPTAYHVLWHNPHDPTAAQTPILVPAFPKPNAKPPPSLLPISFFLHKQAVSPSAKTHKKQTVLPLPLKSSLFLHSDLPPDAPYTLYNTVLPDPDKNLSVHTSIHFQTLRVKSAPNLFRK